MLKRGFTQPTAEEINARKKMYKEAASLGIDLMGYDSNDSSIKRRDRRKAVVLLGTGQSVPEKLKKRLIKKDIAQSGKKKISVKKWGHNNIALSFHSDTLTTIIAKWDIQNNMDRVNKLNARSSHGFLKSDG